MAVSIAQEIRVGTADWRRGTISATVKVTNHGNDPIYGSAGALGFFLKDLAGQYVTGFHRIDPHVADMSGPIPNGGEFEREIHFATGPVAVGQKYTLVCVFDQTADRDEETFEFRQYYLGGVEGAAPFAGAAARN